MRGEDQPGRRRRSWRVVAVATVILVIGAGCGGNPAVATPAPTATASLAGGSSATAPTAPRSSPSALASPGTPGPQGPLGPEGIPVPAVPPLAGLTNAASGSVVDGVQCQTSEQALFHIHAHLTVFVNGEQRQVPYGIGIPNPQAQQTSRGPFAVGGSCFYWLHTHANDGIIHIESPVQQSFTLGDFFDLWGQPLSSSQVGPATGPVVVFENGRQYQGNPRDIPLTAHADIQLEVGSPLVAPVIVSSWNGL